ncbi:MAG: VPLPA-CTERM sorting domain-containing protein [Pseudomonadota bacterium]
MNKFKPLGAAALAIGVFAAAPAEAISTTEVTLARQDGSLTDMSVICPLGCLGIVGTQSGHDADRGSAEFDFTDPRTATIFGLKNSGDKTQFDFLSDLIDLDNQLDTEDSLEIDIGDMLEEAPVQSPDIQFGPDQGTFDLSPGFFLVKVGGNNGGRRTAYLYSQAQQTVQFAISGSDANGLSHYSEFGGSYEQFNIGEPPSGVPTPAALPLLGAGLAVLGILARRRQR